LRRTFEHPECALVDLVANQEELSMPPTISAEQALGFRLYLISGRGDEVIHLAKANLLSR